MSTNKTVYGVVRFVSSIAAKIIFKRKFIRNELKGKKGPIVLIGNHEAALDYTTVIGATKEPMTFVISCANGSNNYIASDFTFEYGSYEVHNRTFVRGTGEAVQDKLIEMLNSLK